MGHSISNSVLKLASPDSWPCDTRKGIFLKSSECGGGELGRRAAEIGNPADIEGMWRGNLG